MADILGLVATAIAGGPIIWSAIKGLSKGQTNVNELVAMSIIGAVSLGWYVEAGLVALILQIGALSRGGDGVGAEGGAGTSEACAEACAGAEVRRQKQKSEDVVVAVEDLRVGDVLVVHGGGAGGGGWEDC